MKELFVELPKVTEMVEVSHDNVSLYLQLVNKLWNMSD